MDPERWRRIEALYHAALAHPADQRDAFLVNACPDPDLRLQVASLIAQSSADQLQTDQVAAALAHLAGESDRSTLIGRRFGVYEVQALLGAGGMGEVYRAHDTRLGREVAIKVLPQAFTSDPDRLARFEREARVLASLNHPHIATIHGLEESGGLRGLVMELVEGPALADKLEQGPLPLSEALPVAAQIAEALQAAHEKGIIHRDLKPANIKITSAGVVKVLDFGLAKVSDPRAPGSSQAPTITVGATAAGLVVGTPAYMSPEQARGQAVDKQTDIWGFGCVLYEMLTGRAAFSAGTVSDTLARVLEHEPAWDALPRSLPPGIRRLLGRCLEKDPRRRLHDIGDAALELQDATTAEVPSRGKRLTLWLTVAVATSAVALAVWLWRGRTTRPLEPLHMTFAQLTSETGVEWFPSLSPDGDWVVYSGESGAHRAIFLQSVSGQKQIDLTGDSPDDDDEPAFSSDGERIAFRSEREGGGIFIMGRTGEAVKRVTRTGHRPTWSPDGTKLAYTTQTIDVNPQNAAGPSELWVVDLQSGASRRLGDLEHAVQASWSPHGNRLAVAVQTGGSSQMDLVTVDAASGIVTPLLTGSAADWNPVWSPDGADLYFSSDRAGAMNLWRLRIDERSGKTLGEPEPLTTPSPYAVHPTISADGRHMAYSSVVITSNVAKISFDPDSGVVEGEPVDVTTGSQPWANPDPSPDGQWVAFYSRQNPEGHIYVARTDGTGLRQLTGDSFLDRVPRWSPDGQWIAFFSNRGGGPYQLWRIRPDGSDLEQMVAFFGSSFPTWSPDGSRVAASSVEERTTYLVDPRVPVGEQRADALPPLPSTGGAFFVVNSWSPDGKELAGQTSYADTGVAIYSFARRAYDVLTDAGQYPVWLPDSRRILFVESGTKFIVVDSVTKQERTVFTDARDVIGPPELTRDGRTAYFSRRITASDIWLLTLEPGDAPRLAAMQ